MQLNVSTVQNQKRPKWPLIPLVICGILSPFILLTALFFVFGMILSLGTLAGDGAFDKLMAICLFLVQTLLLLSPVIGLGLGTVAYVGRRYFWSVTFSVFPLIIYGTYLVYESVQKAKIDALLDSLD